MKPESPFSKLPSLSELLKHPTVQGVVERVNQTTVAQRATGFLEELQTSWKEQGRAPSIGEVAERLAHRLLGRADHSSPTVNATGVVCSRRWQAPLAEDSVRELLRFSSDYQQSSLAIMDQVATSLVKLTGAESAWVASSFEAAVSMTSRCENATIVTSPLIGLRNPSEFGYASIDTIADQIDAGADLVVVDGSGLLGGPRCGVVVGNKESVEELRRGELAGALAADTMVLAALEATLALYRTPEKAVHHIPVLQLLSAPLENLKQRCERIAPLIADCERIESAQPTELESVWLDAGDSQLSAAGWGIALQAAEGGVEKISAVFEKTNPQVIGRVEADELILDFRAIFPRWDQHLVAALE